MRFHKVGKTFQLRIESPDDLRAILELDESLWMATSAPVAAFRCDPVFLTMVDTDANGFIVTGLGGAAWLETSMSGVFAAGDIRAGSIKRVAAAVGEGSTAAMLARERLHAQ